MNIRILPAFIVAGAVHAVVLFAFSNSNTETQENERHIEMDLFLEDQDDAPKTETTQEVYEEPEESLLPKEFEAPGLGEPLPTSVATQAITQFVRPERPRLPRPDGMSTVGIPTAAQRKASGSDIATSILGVLELDRPPAVRFEVAPRYPAELASSGPKGSATILLIVDRKGRVVRVIHENSSHPAFARAAEIAGRKWRFEPGLKDGKPVVFKVRLPVSFNP